MRKEFNFHYGQFIVILSDDIEFPNNNKVYRTNYIYKQRENSKLFVPELKDHPEHCGYHSIQVEPIPLNDQRYCREWRYATQDEINKYYDFDEPYNVITGKIEKVREYIHSIDNIMNNLDKLGNKLENV